MGFDHERRLASRCVCASRLLYLPSNRVYLLRSSLRPGSACSALDQCILLHVPGPSGVLLSSKSANRKDQGVMDVVLVCYTRHCVSSIVQDLTIITTIADMIAAHSLFSFSEPSKLFRRTRSR